MFHLSTVDAQNVFLECHLILIFFIDVPGFVTIRRLFALRYTCSLNLQSTLVLVLSLLKIYVSFSGTSLIHSPPGHTGCTPCSFVVPYIDIIFFLAISCFERSFFLSAKVIGGLTCTIETGFVATLYRFVVDRIFCLKDDGILVLEWRVSLS